MALWKEAGNPKNTARKVAKKWGRTVCSLGIGYGMFVPSSGVGEWGGSCRAAAYGEKKKEKYMGKSFSEDFSAQGGSTRKGLRC